MGTPKTATNATISLPGILNLGMAESLREEFIQCLAANSEIIIDAQKVDNITTPCLQIIIAAGRSMEESESCLILKNPSTAFTDAFRDLGLTNFIEEWSN
jgi:chemotaxis protein CheX